ncbi:hypothetical protein [Methylomagnum ishizawai]|uniref:hypothetical protein n=1 Tax=Methylomagnum ishizawai TaxID=1760988 RepID=UPI001C331DEE|nr:hypothetical protein [Methylomagnum ishizawai]BBL77533.1 hypothetical protein MishRS11D_46310 [Methylomagnum ishizawai]
MNAVVALTDGAAVEPAPGPPMRRWYTPEIARALENRNSSERLKRWLLEALDQEPEEAIAEAQALIELLERYFERINAASEALGLDVEELLRGGV